MIEVRHRREFSGHVRMGPGACGSWAQAVPEPGPP